PRPRSPLSQIITGCRPRRSEASFQVTVQAIADNRPLSATGLRRCTYRRTVMVYGVKYTIRRCPMTEKRDPTTGLTPAEFEAALELTARGFKIVDFSTEPADPAEPDQETE